MMFISTRDNTEAVHASQAIMQGMVPEGGLYLPDQLPHISLDALKAHAKDSYQELAKWVLGLLLDDFTAEEVAACVDAAYNADSFAQRDVTPVVKLDEKLYILELWHGPTAAFKDIALQIMPHLLVTAIRKNQCDRDIVILVATSGDTGKAALEGFKNVAGTEIIVFYPNDGVSPMQELQMVTTQGNNTHVVAVEGNFDDCQRAVKELFADHEVATALNQLGYQFSSANSINWGRLSPQVVYYFSAYLQLVARGQIEFGDEIDFSVPTGNFGNLLAGWIAKAMGLPVRRFICASNENDVLTDFFQSGVYNANRPFVKTISPSMDILVSSNLERFLYLLNDQDGKAVEEWMQKLQTEGRFEVSQTLFEKMANEVVAVAADGATAQKTIHDIFAESHYLLDTHTAVGVFAAQQAADGRPVVVDATANPYKFVQAVDEALHPGAEERDDDVLVRMEELAEETNIPVHRALAALTQSGARPRAVIKQGEIREQIFNILEERRQA